ncbi:hypothetical protein JW916_09560 [Candidatus Sumerlaeota bacterium]|nr:hypothetical protein [Candidatus Sumerlaeota bacterium]
MCLLVLALSPPARGRQAGQTSAGGVEAALTLSRKEIFVGEPVEGQLVVRWTPPATVQDVVLTDESLSGFQVLDQSCSPDEKLPDGSMRRVVSFKATGFEIGDRSVGPIEVAYVDGEGNSATVEAPAQTIQVASYLEQMEAKGREVALAPIEPPVLWPGLSPRKVAAWTAVGLAVLGAAFYLARWMRSRRRGPQAVETVILSPEEEALQALSEIEASGMMDREPAKVFYSRLSEILRRYLGRRYAFDALEMTSSELLTQVDRLGWREELRRVLMTDTAEADSVKFARYDPARPRRIGAIGRVREIVETTRPPSPSNAGVRE